MSILSIWTIESMHVFKCMSYFNMVIEWLRLTFSHAALQSPGKDQSRSQLSCEVCWLLNTFGIHQLSDSNWIAKTTDPSCLKKHNVNTRLKPRCSNGKPCE